MSVAYLDTSCLLAVAFCEEGWETLVQRLSDFDALVCSNLLEAEYRSALEREQVTGGLELLDRLTWVLPDRRLTAEIERALGAMRLRGADLWHVATALYLADSPADVAFLTLDSEQREAARALGFATPL